MHILLTDILACPVCGPPSGLIVRSDEMRDRRVIEGALACPNCERHFPVRGGIAALDPSSERIPGDTAPTEQPADPGIAVRIAALLGLADARGWVLLAGPAASAAGGVRDLVEGIEIVAEALHAPTDAANRLILGDRLPFYGGKFHGIWLGGESAGRWLEEAARALHPIGRLVLEPAPADAAARLEAAGLRVIAEAEATLVATRM